MPYIFDLSVYKLKRLVHIRWRFPEITATRHPWELIQDKNLKNKLQNVEKIIEDNKISSIFRLLPSSEFTSWIDFYKGHMKALGYNILASVEKFNSFLELGLKLYTFDIFIADKLAGRQLITLNDEGRANSCFRVSDHIPSLVRKVSLGVFFDYLLIQNLLQRKDVKMISFGKSINQFGANKIGYLRYKLQFGQIPYAAETGSVETVEINPEGYVFFYGLNEKDEMKLYSIKPNISDENYDMIKKIAPEGVIELEQ